MIEKRSIKSNSHIKDSLHVESINFLQNKPVLSRPSTTFTSVPIKLIKYHLSRPLNSRAKFLESIQKSTIICYRCKKLKPNTFLKDSQVSVNKICDCSQQMHSIKIQKPIEKKLHKEKSKSFEYAPLFAEGKRIAGSPPRIRKFFSEFEPQGLGSALGGHLENGKEGAVKWKFLIFKGNNSGIVKDAMKRRDSWVEGYYSITSTVSFIWQPTSYGIKFDRLKVYLPLQLINHFEHHGELSNKASLYKNIYKYCKESEISVHSIVPLTFILETKTYKFKSQLENFKKHFDNFNKSTPPGHFIGKGIWILKPSGFNRGRGIHIFNTPEMLENLLNSIELNSNYIIQKYIESPLLFNNRKFDIRMWVLITHDNRCYYFPEGYIRTSSEDYSISSNLLNNKFVHLTNNAVQKDSASYGKFENGNQISFRDFQEYLEKSNEFGTFDKILLQIRGMILISLGAAKEKLNPKQRQHCFEIFGYDFIIDSELKPWLIEINTNPCLELSSPLLSQLIPRMLEDALSLTVDMLFPCPFKSPLETVSVLDLPKGNLWDFLIKI